MFKNTAIIAAIIITVSVAGFFAYILTAPKGEEPGGTAQTLPLNIKTQKPGGSIIVESASLSERDFLAVHLDEGGTPGKIIGISALLPPGENKNVTINLTEGIKDGQIIYVTAHVDGNGDGLFQFPGPDIPAEDGSGNMVLARIAVAGELAADKSEARKTDTGNLNVVNYTEKGFFPVTIQIKVGQSVVFQNISDFDMWIVSDPHPAHNALPGFDERTSVKSGGKYAYVFTKVGEWGYHNENNPAKKGTVIVTE